MKIKRTLALCLMALCLIALAGRGGALKEAKSEAAPYAMPYNLITLYDRETDAPVLSIQGFCDLEDAVGGGTDTEVEAAPPAFICQTGPTEYENYNFLLFESTTYTVEEVEIPTTTPYKVILTQPPLVGYQ